jgi:hypothetical protein
LKLRDALALCAFGGTHRRSLSREG